MVLLLTIGAVMIRCHSQKPHEIPVAIRCATAGLGDSEGVDRINSLRRFHADDFFPPQTVVSVELAPAQLPDFSQGIQRRVAFWFLQAEQVILKNGVIQIKANRAVVGTHSVYWRCDAAAKRASVCASEAGCCFAHIE